MTAPESLTYGRHAIGAKEQRHRDRNQRRHEVTSILHELWLDQRFALAMLVVLAFECSTVFALIGSGLPVPALAVMLLGGLGISVGVAVKAMGSGEK